MSEYGIKVSKPGVNVNTATDKDLLLNSLKSIIKVENFQHVDVTISGGSGSTVVAHSFGHVPFVIAFAIISGAYYELPFSTSSYYTDGYLTVTSTNITFYLGTLDLPDGTYPIYYYISESDAIA